jgi:hypothetical protein
MFTKDVHPGLGLLADVPVQGAIKKKSLFKY